MKRLVLTLVLLLFLVSCNSANTERNPDYRYGSQALDMRITHGAGQTVYDGDEMSLLIELHNKGTADITSGMLFVKGFDPQYLPNIHFSPSSVLNLNGKDQFDPNGDLTYFIELQDFSVKAPRYKEILPQTLQIIACYPYRTLGSYEVCVDPDPYNRIIDNKICSYTETQAGAQGHPVAVTNIKEQVSSTDIYFTLTISNVGDGIIYNPLLSPEACAYDLDRTTVDQVFVNSVDLSGIPLQCEPQNPIRLINSGSATVRCTCVNCVNIDQGAYRTVLNVDLSYGYRNERQTNINIVQR